MKVAKHIEAGSSELQDRAEFFWIGASLVMVVADGAGGLSGGAEAAEFVVQCVRERVELDVITPGAIEELLRDVDRDMAGARSYGETTCAVVAVSQSGVIGASVGDSGAFVISESGIDSLTSNQNRKPFIGSGQAVPVSFSRGSLQGTLLIASDGLLKYTSMERIAASVRGLDVDEALQGLARLVRYPSGTLPDDLSILLAQKT